MQWQKKLFEHFNAFFLLTNGLKKRPIKGVDDDL